MIRSVPSVQSTIHKDNPQEPDKRANLRKLCYLRSLRSNSFKIKPIVCGLLGNGFDSKVVHSIFERTLEQPLTLKSQCSHDALVARMMSREFFRRSANLSRSGFDTLDPAFTGA